MGNKKTAGRHSLLQSFTFIELLLVTLLLGVIAGLAVPNLTHLYSNLQLSETTKNIVFLMRYAQGRAIVRRSPHRINFDIEQSLYQMTQEASSQGSEEAAGENFQPIPGKLGRSFTIPPEITLASNQPFVTFYPDGKIAKVRIYLHDRRDRYFTISTEEQLGYVQILEGKVE